MLLADRDVTDTCFGLRALVLTAVVFIELS